MVHEKICTVYVGEWLLLITSISVTLIVGPKGTVAASHAAPGESHWVCRRDRRTDGRTPDRYITLSAMDAASVQISLLCVICASRVRKRWRSVVKSAVNDVDCTKRRCCLDACGCVDVRDCVCVCCCLVFIPCTDQLTIVSLFLVDIGCE